MLPTRNVFAMTTGKTPKPIRRAVAAIVAVGLVATVLLAQAPDLDALRMAAEQGEAEAQYVLGYRYATGIGVRQDTDEAVLWLRRAADQGHRQADEFLGRLFPAEVPSAPQDANDAETPPRTRVASVEGPRDIVVVEAQPPQAVTSGATLSAAEIIQRSLPATVTIEATTASGVGSSGSGFIVEPSGIIITNLHVLRGATMAKISLQNGDVYDRVTVRAVDEQRDIAILQVPGFRLPTIPLADSDTVRPGEAIVLLGAPLGLRGTATTGIVSAIRPFEEYRVFQTDAAASPGNSGGPAINEEGAVVGILTFKLGADQGENLNFIVPVNYARGLISTNDGLSLDMFAAQYPAAIDFSPNDASADIYDLPQLAPIYVSGNGNIAAVEQNGADLRISWMTSTGSVYGTTTHVWDATRNGFIGGGTMKTRCGFLDTRIWDAPLVEEIFVYSDGVILDRWLMPTKVNCDQQRVISSEWKTGFWTAPQ